MVQLQPPNSCTTCNIQAKKENSSRILKKTLFLHVSFEVIGIIPIPVRTKNIDVSYVTNAGAR